MTEERFQDIRTALFKAVELGNGQPRGYGVRMPGLVNIIKESVPDCSFEEAVYVTDECRKTDDDLIVDVYDDGQGAFRSANEQDLGGGNLWLRKKGGADPKPNVHRRRLARRKRLGHFLAFRRSVGHFRGE